VESEPPEIQLMLVRDPEETIKALCNLGDTFTLQDYVFQYEVVKKLEKPIHIKNAHTHFYSLSLFGFIQQDEHKAKGTYRLTKAGTDVCSLLKTDRRQKASEVIRYLLLNNFKKGELFQDFQNFAKKEKRFGLEDAKKRYKKWRTLPTLIEWSIMAGIIDIDRDSKRIWYLGDNQQKNISMAEFSSIFLDAFHRMKSETTFGTDIFYAEIAKIRTLMCLKLLWSNEQWNSHMVKLLKSKQGKKLKLYGSTPSTFETKETFRFEDTLYAYIGIED